MLKKFMNSISRIAWRKFIAAECGSKEEDFWNNICVWFQERNYA